MNDAELRTGEMEDREFDIWMMAVRRILDVLVSAVCVTLIFLGILLIIIPAVSAWVGDCGTSPCPMNRTLPTQQPVSWPNLTGDFENSTYMRYWFNYSTPFDFPWLAFGYSLQLPFLLQFGTWFYAIIWFLYLGMVYMRAQDPILPAVIGILSATVIGTFLPQETFIPAVLMFVAAVVTILMRVLVERK